MKIESDWSLDASFEVWRNVFEIVEEHFDPPCSVLDLGCGKHRWSAKGFEMTRIDIRPMKGSIQHDLNRPIPLETNSQDYTVAAEIIEHLESPLAFLREIARVTSRLAIITAPDVTTSPGFYSTDTYRLWGHISIISDWLLAEHFRRLGMIILEKRLVSLEQDPPDEDARCVVYLVKP